MRYLITSHGLSVSERERRGLNRILYQYNVPYLANPIVNVDVDVPQELLLRFKTDFIEVAQTCRLHSLGGVNA